MHILDVGHVLSARRQLRRLARLQTEFHLATWNLLDPDVCNVQVGSPQQLQHAGLECWIVELLHGVADARRARPIDNGKAVRKPVPQRLELLVVELNRRSEKQCGRSSGLLPGFLRSGEVARKRRPLVLAAGLIPSAVEPGLPLAGLVDDQPFVTNALCVIREAVLIANAIDQHNDLEFGRLPRTGAVKAIRRVLLGASGFRHCHGEQHHVAQGGHREDEVALAAGVSAEYHAATVQPRHALQAGGDRVRIEVSSVRARHHAERLLVPKGSEVLDAEFNEHFRLSKKITLVGVNNIRKVL